MMSASVTSSSVARKAATRWVGRSEMKPTVSDRIALRPTAASSARIVGSSVANSMSPGITDGAGQPVEQRRFAGVGIADQRDHRIGHAAPRLAMQRPRPLDAVEFAFAAGQCARRSAGDRFRAGFRRAAEKAKPTALALEMGPGPHEPRALVVSARQFDLQPALMGARPRAKNFQDQPRAVDDLALASAARGCAAAPGSAAVDDDQPDRRFR